MATRKPLVVVSGQVQELPAGDVPAGAEPSIAAPVSAPTEKYWRGDKTWRDFFTDVRAATLTGLSTATNAAVAATDTVLAAIGKLQAQITGHVGASAGAHSASAISNTPAGGVAATTVQAAINELDSEKLNKTGGPISGDISVAGNILTTSGALGYGAGAGGAATQPTSKSSTVALNKPSGQISMNSASLAAGASVEFSLVNSFLSAADGLVVNPSGFSGYSVEVAYFNSPTEVVLRVTNKGATRSDPVVIIFRIFKGASS